MKQPDSDQLCDDRPVRLPRVMDYLALVTMHDQVVDYGKQSIVANGFQPCIDPPGGWRQDFDDYDRIVIQRGVATQRLPATYRRIRFIDRRVVNLDGHSIREDFTAETGLLHRLLKPPEHAALDQCMADALRAHLDHLAAIKLVAPAFRLIH